jgi:hypothetical protein
MEGFEGLWFDCETGDQGVTSVEQVKILRCNLIVVTSSTTVYETFYEVATAIYRGVIADQISNPLSALETTENELDLTPNRNSMLM